MNVYENIFNMVETTTTETIAEKRYHIEGGTIIASASAVKDIATGEILNVSSAVFVNGLPCPTQNYREAVELAEKWANGAEIDWARFNQHA